MPASMEPAQERLTWPFVRVASRENVSRHSDFQPDSGQHDADPVHNEQGGCRKDHRFCRGGIRASAARVWPLQSGKLRKSF